MLFEYCPDRTGPESRLPTSCQQFIEAIRRFGHASHGRSRRFARRLVPVVDFLTTGEPTKNSTQQKKMKSRRNTFLVTRSFFDYFCSFDQTEPLRQRTPLEPTTSRRGRPPPFSQQVKQIDWAEAPAGATRVWRTFLSSLEQRITLKYAACSSRVEYTA